MSLSGTLIETSSELMLSSDRASFEESFTNENNLELRNGDLVRPHSLVSYTNISSRQVIEYLPVTCLCWSTTQRFCSFYTPVSEKENQFQEQKKVKRLLFNYLIHQLVTI